MMVKNRTIYILKYLWDHTDEENPATTNEIIEHLSSFGIVTTRKTVTEDISELQNSGIDIVCNRSRQNEYFIGTRHLELVELKLLVDAVQAARFISPKKSKELIGKISSLASPYQSAELKRNLFVDGKAKTDNEKVFYAVDTLYTAIQENKSVTFKYVEYTAEKKKVYKHIKNEYIDSRACVPVRIDGRFEKELIAKAKRVLALQRKGINLIFPDVIKIEKALLS